MTLLAFMALFDEFKAASWNGWRAVLTRLGPLCREFWAMVGRGAGKSRIAAMIVDWIACRPYKLAPGENIYCGIVAPDRRQSSITFKYAVGLLHSRPELAAMIVRETSDTVELANGVIITVITAAQSLRSRAFAVLVFEEAAFQGTDDAAFSDVELMRAARPALAKVPGSLFVVVSSTYARRGITWEAAQKYAATGGSADGRVVYVQATTLELNPIFDAAAVATALEEDPAGAAAEYLSEFRSDVESFVTREAVDAVVIPDRIELPYMARHSYVGFVDFAGGAGQDSATMAIAHPEHRKEGTVAVLDLVREVRPPFSPEQVCADFAATLKSYQITKVTADKYAGDFPAEQLRKHGVELTPSERTKSDIYKEILSSINSRRLELLDNPRLVAQLCGLERRVARGGKDSIDHAPRAHDDLCNSACGALLLVANKKKELPGHPYFNWAIGFGWQTPSGRVLIGGDQIKQFEIWCDEHPEEVEKWNQERAVKYGG